MKSLLSFICICVILVLVVNWGGGFVFAAALSRVLGVEVKAGSLHINPLKTKISLINFKVNNPEGYSEKTLTLLPEILIDFDLSGLMQKKFIVREVHVKIGEVTLERNAQNQMNLMDLKPAQNALHQPSSPEVTTNNNDFIEVEIQSVLFSLEKVRYVDAFNGSPNKVKEIPLNIKSLSLRGVKNTPDFVREAAKIIMNRTAMAALLPDMGTWSEILSANFSTKMEEMKSGFDDFVLKVRGSFANKS